MAAVPPPPPPPLPPPPPPGRVLRDALERAGAALGGDGGVRELLRRRRDSLTPPLKWLLFHRPAPPLIQDGPQCGLVALSMAASLLFPTHGVQLGQLVRAAQERGFTHRGEMFSAADMAALARDVFPCHPELLSGGLEGPNLPRILQHLISGLPLLVPYDEDSNHEPCQRRGHKAHWAVLTGVLLGVRTAALSPTYRPDPEIPNLFHPPASGGGELVLGGSGLRWGGPGGGRGAGAGAGAAGEEPPGAAVGAGGAARQQRAAERAQPPAHPRRPPLRAARGGAGAGAGGARAAAAPPGQPPRDPPRIKPVALLLGCGVSGRNWGVLGGNSGVLGGSGVCVSPPGGELGGKMGRVGELVLLHPENSPPPGPPPNKTGSTPVRVRCFGEKLGVWGAACSPWPGRKRTVLGGGGLCCCTPRATPAQDPPQ